MVFSTKRGERLSIRRECESPEIAFYAPLLLLRINVPEGDIVLVLPVFPVILENEKLAIGRKAKVDPIRERSCGLQRCYFFACAGAPYLEVALLFVSGKQAAIRRKMHCFNRFPIFRNGKTFPPSCNVPDSKRPLSSPRIPCTGRN